MSDLIEIKKELRVAVVDDMSDALKKFNTYIKSDTRLATDLIMLEARFNSTRKKQNGGLLSESQANLSFNRINYSFLQLVDEIKDDHLKEVGFEIPPDVPMSPSPSRPDPVLNPKSGDSNKGAKSPQPDFDKMDKQSLMEQATALQKRLKFFRVELVNTADTAKKFELSIEIEEMEKNYKIVREKLGI